MTPNERALPVVDVLAELRRQGVTGGVYAAVEELIESNKELLVEWDRQDNGRFDTFPARWWELAEARFRLAVAGATGLRLECNCPGHGKGFASQHAPNCPARPYYVMNPERLNGNGI